MPLLLFSFRPKVLDRSIQALSREEIKQQHVPWSSCLEYWVVSDIAWCRGKVILSKETIATTVWSSWGKETKWKLQGEWVDLFTSLYLSSSQIGWWVENPGAQKEHFILMKTVFHPIITAAEGNENASASILNQNSFFRVIFTFLPVSLDGCTADMDSQWLLKYSLQRTGVKQSHILLFFYSSGLTFLQQSQHCKHLSALNKKQQCAGLNDCFSFFSGFMHDLFYLAVSAFPHCLTIMHSWKLCLSFPSLV